MDPLTIVERLKLIVKEYNTKQDTAILKKIFSDFAEFLQAVDDDIEAQGSEDEEDNVNGQINNEEDDEEEEYETEDEEDEEEDQEEDQEEDDDEDEYETDEDEDDDEDEYETEDEDEDEDEDGDEDEDEDEDEDDEDDEDDLEAAEAYLKHHTESMFEQLEEFCEDYDYDKLGKALRHFARLI
jgi:hypothetical protein